MEASSVDTKEPTHKSKASKSKTQSSSSWICPRATLSACDILYPAYLALTPGLSSVKLPSARKGQLLLDLTLPHAPSAGSLYLLTTEI